MSPVDTKQLPGSGVPEVHCAVPGAGSDALAIGRPADAAHPFFVACTMTRTSSRVNGLLAVVGCGSPLYRLN